MPIKNNIFKSNEHRRRFYPSKVELWEGGIMEFTHFYISKSCIGETVTNIEHVTVSKITCGIVCQWKQLLIVRITNNNHNVLLIMPIVWIWMYLLEKQYYDGNSHNI